MARSNVHWDDEWADSSSTTPAPTPAPATRAPRLSQEERDQRKATKAKEAHLETRRAVARRKRWEQTPEGQERSVDIQQATGGTHTPAQAYHELGIRHSGMGHGQDTLPGMEDPHTLHTPTRWEDLTPEQQAHGQRELRRRAGTDIPTMSKQFGAQMDQGYLRALSAGHTDPSGAPTPFTKHFYDDDTPEGAPEPLDRPKKIMTEAARKHGVDLRTMVAATALTSPNVKFTEGPRGARTSPNVAAAESAVIQHHEGVPSYNMTHLRDPETGKATSTARPANLRRAGRMLEHVAQGGQMSEARNAPSLSNPEGSSMWNAPKVGPFANSFQSDVPDFFVSDLHSGGGGMVPHLGTEKPFKLDAEGNRIRNREFRDDPRSDEELEASHRGGAHKVYVKEKSERELAIETPHFHSMADYAARQALKARGMGESVRQGQAVQWGEEQIRRKIETPRLDVPSHEMAYPKLGRQFEDHPDHPRLF